jgi:hypothetical protein
MHKKHEYIGKNAFLKRKAFNFLGLFLIALLL